MERIFFWLLVVMRILDQQTAKDMKITLSVPSVMIMMVVFPNLHVVAGTFCVDNISLRAGQRGVVSCDFREFDVVGWLYSTQNLESTEPFIYLEGSEVAGPGSRNGKYSMFPNGSLIIKHVSINHEQNYTVRIVRNGPTVSHFVVSVKVHVLPIPEYPVVNGQTDHQHVVIQSSDGTASLKCTMDNVRPAISLEVSPVPNGISMKTISSTLNNSDGTYNVSLDATFEMRNGHPVGVYDVLCRVAGNFAPFLKSVTTISLVVHVGGQYQFPLVNGMENRQHVVLDVNREGRLTCSMDRVLPNVNLEWSHTHHYSSNKVALERSSHFFFDNGDGTYNISSITSYKATDHSIQSITLKCGVSGNAADLHPLFTTVELHFPAAGEQHKFPIVNGMDNQQHIDLDVNRDGTLSCSMDRVSSNVNLEWKHIHHRSSAEVALEWHGYYKLHNGDGTYNITSVTRYKTTNDAVQCVTLKCGVSGDAADLYPLYTTVELHFPAADSAIPRNTFNLSHALSILFGITTALLAFVIIYLCKKWTPVNKQVPKVQKNQKDEAPEEEDSAFPLTPSGVAVE